VFLDVKLTQLNFTYVSIMIVLREWLSPDKKYCDAWPGFQESEIKMQPRNDEMKSETEH